MIWEKIFANQIFEKDLVSILYKELLLFKNLKKTFFSWAKNLNPHFSNEDMQMVNKNMKRCSTSLVIREMQTKTIMRYT